jgi:electron transfer flavoprotein beta subunit
MGSHIIVCIKSVVRSAPGGIARRQPENSELNPFDRPAIEAALTIAEARGGSVTALTMGPPVANAALAEAQAMGVDRCVLVSDPALAGSDTLVTARVLAAAARQMGAFEFMCFGTRTSDSDTGQVGPQTAAVLNLPFLSGVKEIQAQNAKWQLKRTMDAWEEQWDVRPPAALSIHPKAFKPRPVGLIGVAEAFDQPNIETLGLDDLGLLPQQVGLTGSPTRVVNMQTIKRSRTCELIDGEPAEQVAALVERLNERGVLT